MNKKITNLAITFLICVSLASTAIAEIVSGEFSGVLTSSYTEDGREGLYDAKPTFDTLDFNVLDIGGVTARTPHADPGEFSFTWNHALTGLINTGIQPAITSWYDLKVERVNGVLTIYLDGNVAVSVTASTNIDANGQLEIGTYSGSRLFAGDMDQLSITKGN